MSHFLELSENTLTLGLVLWNAAVEVYVKTYSLCVTARKEVRKGLNVACRVRLVIPGS